MKNLVVMQYHPFYLHVCVKKGMTDKEIVRHTEVQVPSGMLSGWEINEKLGRVECADSKDREHIVLSL